MTYWYWFRNKNPSRILGVRVSKELPQSAMPLNLSQNRLQVITVTTQPAFTSPKSTMDTPEQCVKSIWSQQWKKEREKIDVNPRLHGLLWTDFTKFSGISTACFGQVNSGWVLIWLISHLKKINQATDNTGEHTTNFLNKTFWTSWLSTEHCRTRSNSL